jgi:GTPase SAR1 family protein
MGAGSSHGHQAVASNAKTGDKKDTSDQFHDMALSCRLRDLCDPKSSQDRPSAAESDQTAVSNQADKGTWNSGMSKKTDKDSSVSAMTESDIGISTSDISSQVNYTCHWKLHVKTGPGDGSRLNEWNGHVVGILGQFNRGKTWVMGRLSSYQFPAEGLTSRTEGMSFKWVRTVSRTAGLEVQDDLWHLVIDTAGFNVPIPLAEHNSSAIKRKQRMEEAQGKTKSSAKQQDSRRRINEFLDSVIKDSTATGEEGNESELVIEKANKRMIEEDDYEKFLASMTLSLSNYIILVVTESNLQEQRFLFDVVRKWRDCQPAKDPKCSDVFVVHNFMTIDTEGERHELFLVKHFYFQFNLIPN